MSNAALPWISSPYAVTSVFHRWHIMTHLLSERPISSGTIKAFSRASWRSREVGRGFHHWNQRRKNHGSMDQFFEHQIIRHAEINLKSIWNQSEIQNPLFNWGSWDLLSLQVPRFPSPTDILFCERNSSFHELLHLCRKELDLRRVTTDFAQVSHNQRVWFDCPLSRDWQKDMPWDPWANTKSFQVIPSHSTDFEISTLLPLLGASDNFPTPKSSSKKTRCSLGTCANFKAVLIGFLSQRSQANPTDTKWITNQ